MTGRIRVLLADDHAVLRRSLSTALSALEWIEVAGEAACGSEAVALAGRLQPDVVLMDVSMPRVGGVEATEQIVRHWPQIRVIGLSMHDENLAGKRMRDAGAAEYLTKHADLETLLEVIRGAVRQD